MRTADWLTVAYFGAMLVVAFGRRLPARARVKATATTLLVWAALVLVADRPVSAGWPSARDVVPILFILAAYWQSGCLFTAPSPRLENWLLATDRRIFQRFALNGRLARAPRLALEGLELAYLSVYPMILGGALFAVTLVSEAERNRVWTLILIAAYGAYGALPWFQCRPPRALEPPGEIDGRALLARRLNLLVLRHGSIQVNTFPSGHVSTALAVAIGVWQQAPVLGTALAALALAIGAGAFVGRYHYAADVAAGFLLALVAWVVTLTLPA